VVLPTCTCSRSNAATRQTIRSGYRRATSHSGQKDFNEAYSRIIFDFFDTIIVIILPDGTRALADTRLFPDKMFNSLGVSPSVYVCCSSKDYDPQIRNLDVQRNVF